ncbi:MAG: InlB B-repeat-containing protein, partial [Clostridia bacterium]|nr:InlB B-repeat-containing protein [Clostridia bacterium]
MKKLLKILSVAIAAVLIVTTFSIGLSAYAATDDVIGNYNFEITSTYKDVDWQNWKAYKAATHVHTTRSDADEEVDDMIENYYSLGFDALALTDHGTVNYGWTSGQSRIAIFAYQAFVHGGIDEPSTTRYNEITNGTGAVKGGSSPRGYGMTEIPKGIELNGMSTKKCHINGYFVDAGHGELGTTVTWPRSAVKTNYDAGGITHINHVGEWAEAKNNISVYDASFVQDFASVYEDYCPNRPNYSQSTIRGCIGMELVNTTDNRTRNDRYLYDETMKLLAPQGINIFVFCEDDAHEASDCDKNAQYFLMPSNDKQSKNIEYCMKHGQFYTCSKNSKNPYELGDGFSASGEYPVVSYVGVENESNQIIVTVKNANKARLVADGNLIDTIDTTLGENTVVFDLNKYEDKINSYVRAYFTGPGGILYLQTFLVKKTAAERSSVQFNTPSADTEVKVYNSNGSIVEPANTDYVYLLEPGDYTYIASRPGYITTDPIPFTVTQEEYENNVKKQIDVTLEINSDLVYTYFYVPETIYLNGSDNKTFESYVDRQNSPDGALNQKASSTGNIFFARPGATDIRISYTTVEGVSINSLTTTALESNGPTFSGTISSGSMSSSLDSGGYSIIEWVANYKCNGTNMTSKAFSYIYAPLRGSNSTVAAGGFAKTKKSIGWLHDTMSLTATTWMVGVHGVSNGYTAYKFTPNGGSALTNSSGIDSLTVSGTGMITSDDDSSGGSVTVNPAGAIGTLTVDLSRYNNLNQIPGLKFGLDINDATDDRDNAEQYFEINGQRVFTKSNASASSMNGQRIYMSSAAQSGYSVPLSTSVTSINFTGSASCSKENRTDRVTGTVTLQLSYVNKASLRDRYNSAVQFSYQPDWFSNPADYNNYIAQIKEAEKVLGNPAANSAQIESASNALSAFMGTVALAEGSATINHVDTYGNILETETTPYTICDTIVVSAKEFEGYTYADSWVELDGANEINSGTDSYESLMTLKTAYTINFIYDANDYEVTFVSGDSSYIPNANTCAEYNNVYNLPTAVPQKAGYDFAGWHFDADNTVYPAGGTVHWNYTHGGTFTAEFAPKTYSAIFDVNGGKPGYEITTLSVTYEDIFDVPAEIPEKDGYAFEGWDVYDSSNNYVDTHTAGGRFVWEYAENLTFKAKWTISEFTVSFDSQGGTAFQSITVIYGSKYGELPVPEKSGFNFDGWYLDTGYTVPVDSNTTVTAVGDHTLYAKWTKGN